MEKDAFYIKGSIIEKKEKGESSIGLLDVYPFDLSKCAPLIDELPQGTSRLIAVLHCSTFNIQKPEIKTFARLISQTTDLKIPLRILLLNKHQDGGTQIFLLGLQMSELQPGKYALDFLVKETKTQSEALATTNFIVR